MKVITFPRYVKKERILHIINSLYAAIETLEKERPEEMKDYLPAINAVANKTINLGYQIGEKAVCR